MWQRISAGWRASFFFAALLIVFAAPRAVAAPGAREIEITPTVLAETPAFVTPVVVPGALCAAVSDAASLLVVGHRAVSNQHLAVFKLDADGRPAGAPLRVTLPKPAVLATNANYPLGLLFHPRLPILYVWQDVNAPPPDKQEKHAAFTDYLEFDHLLIFAVTNGGLELLQTAAHGAGFHCGLGGGTIGLDFDAKTLFVPNAVGGTWDESGIGYYALDEQGLPQNPDKLDGATPKPKGARAPALAKTKIERTLATLQRKRTHRYYPSGAGWVAGRDAMIMGGYSGCLVADFPQGNLRQAWFNLPDAIGNCIVGGHPSAPAIYLSLLNTSRLFQIGHADGYVSLLPQTAVAKGAQLSGAPVVLTRQARVAVGAGRAVVLFGLQPDGRFDGKAEQFAVPSATVRSLAYSEKRGRLYVPVERGN